VWSHLPAAHASRRLSETSVFIAAEQRCPLGIRDRETLESP
jgi:hypothetical protein